MIHDIKRLVWVVFIYLLQIKMSQACLTTKCLWNLHIEATCLRLSLSWAHPCTACGRSHILSALNRVLFMQCNTVCADWARQRACNGGRYCTIGSPCPISFLCTNPLIWLKLFHFLGDCSANKSTFRISLLKDTPHVEKIESNVIALSETPFVAIFFLSARCYCASCRPCPCSSNTSQQIPTSSLSLSLLPMSPFSVSL